jgi:hypothetical protein
VVLEEYVAYFNGCRPHQALQQYVPVPRSTNGCAADGNVIAIPVLGGLHHDYRTAA